MSDSSMSPGRSRKPQKPRVVKIKSSCDSCARRKQRCDREKPVCTRCKAQGFSCTFSPSLRVGKPKKATPIPLGVCVIPGLHNHGNTRSDTTTTPISMLADSPEKSPTQDIPSSYGTPFVDSPRSFPYPEVFSATIRAQQLSDEQPPFYNLATLMTPDFDVPLNTESFDFLGNLTTGDGSNLAVCTSADNEWTSMTPSSHDHVNTTGTASESFPGHYRGSRSRLDDNKDRPQPQSRSLSASTESFNSIRSGSLDASPFAAASPYTPPSTYASPEWAKSNEETHDECVMTARTMLVNLHRLPQVDDADTSASNDLINDNLDKILSMMQTSLSQVSKLLDCTCSSKPLPLLNTYLQLIMAEIASWHGAILKSQDGDDESRIQVSIGTYVVANEHRDALIRQIVDSQVRTLRELGKMLTVKSQNVRRC